MSLTLEIVKEITPIKVHKTIYVFNTHNVSLDRQSVRSKRS